MSGQRNTRVKFEITKDVHWDNWGRLTKVFFEGDICSGLLWEDGELTAESPYFEGVTDMIDKDHYRLITS